MIEYGRSIRWFNDYNDEVTFSRKHQFDFMQVWFMKGELILDQVQKPKEQVILNVNYPVIIHAVFDLDDFELYTHELLRILIYLGHNEVIIHPIVESHPITEDTIHTMAEKKMIRINY